MDYLPRVGVLLLVIAASCCCFSDDCRAAEPAGDGWVMLFDGRDLAGWQNAGGNEPGGGWVIEEGAVVRQKGSGDIWTRQRFGDFILDLEFKATGNSGIFIRTDNPRDNVQTGMEIQVDRPAGNPGRHSTGALYDCVAPTKVADKANEWNHIVITAKDNKITVVMNDEQIIDMDLNQWTEARKNPDGSGNKFRTALKDFKREGHIGLQDHGAVVAYRNIKLKPLD